MKKLILASQSPRRSEILKKAGYQFVPFPVYVSEIPDKNLSLDGQILDIAKRKADEVLVRLQAEGLGSDDAVILTADTMVCFDDQALGKPDDDKMAVDYLRLLSGRKHQVKTALYLVDLKSGEHVSHIETTDVHFKKLSEDEIQTYIATGEPRDKAGAYAIQGKGFAFVEKFDGDFNNVVGLPLQALENVFRMKSWIFQKTLNGL
ncbi:MAG: Maf family protein [Bdellovibrionaceae bacterium]|nr:Maf family protein [Pseudobdellovibrionaceae bacterium]